MPKTTSAERMRRMRRLNREDPDRKHRALDTLFMFGCVDVAVIVDKNGGIWFKGVDLARALEMENPNTAIYDTLDKMYYVPYEQLTSAVVGYRHIPNIHPKTTFVNEMGMNLFVLRSRMPKAEAFAEWVCGEVLPSIRKSGRYEIDPDSNPYRELNEYLKKEVENLKSQINTKDAMLEKQLSLISTLNGQLFDMRPTCILPMTGDEKEEYFVLYRKFDAQKLKEVKDAELLHFPYYACRVQLHSLDDRRQNLKVTYPDLRELLRLKVPNSVNFFNYAVSELSDMIERGRKGCVQSFGIVRQCEKNFHEQEKKMLTMISNLHRSKYGSSTEKKL